MPKRVLIVAGRMDLGGLEMMVMNFFRLMDPEKIVFDFMLNYSEQGAFDEEIRSLGGKIFIMPRLYVKNLFRYILAVNRFFKQHKGEYDIVHGHLTSVGFIYLSIAKMHGVKTTIIHAHYADTKNNFKGMIEKLTILPVRFCADYYFACSNKAGQFCFGKKKLEKKNYQLIKNGVVVEHFLYHEQTRNSKRGQMHLEDKFVVIHIGRFEKEKNHHFLMDVFKCVCEKDNHAVLLLVGNGSMLQEIKEKAESLHLLENVKFLHIRNDIGELLNAADVFIMPSFYEGLPVVSVEAQASGIPCIFSDTITKEVDITGNCTFLSLQDSPRIWAEKILDHQNRFRENTKHQIDAAGYNIKEQALWLQDFYLNH